MEQAVVPGDDRSALSVRDKGDAVEAPFALQQSARHRHLADGAVRNLIASEQSPVHKHIHLHDFASALRIIVCGGRTGKAS